MVLTYNDWRNIMNKYLKLLEELKLLLDTDVSFKDELEKYIELCEGLNN
jgi:hypothetical protein